MSWRRIATEYLIKKNTKYKFWLILLFYSFFSKLLYLVKSSLIRCDLGVFIVLVKLIDMCNNVIVRTSYNCNSNFHMLLTYGMNFDTFYKNIFTTE